MAFTSADIGPWVRVADRATARVNLRRVLNAKVPATVDLIPIKASLLVAIPPGLILFDEQISIEALYSATDPGLEWSWDGLTLRLLNRRNLPPDRVTPL